MLIPTAYIVMGKLATGRVNGLEIVQDIEAQTDTATVRLPRRTVVRENGVASLISDWAKPGQAIEIYAGLEGKMELEFKGYVVRPRTDNTTELICEDEMWVLKNTSVEPKTFRASGTVLDVVKYVAGSYSITCPVVKLGANFAITRNEPTAATVLKKLKEVYGLRAYFLLENGKPVLHLGQRYSYQTLTGKKPVKVQFGRNIVDGSIELRQRESFLVRIQATSVQKNGKRLTARFKGDSMGETLKIAIPGLSQEELEKEAKRAYDQYRQDRLEGDITLFFQPKIVVGDALDIRSRDNRNQVVVFADKRILRYDEGGGRQIITLGRRAL